MTNEELATAIKDGKHELTEQLWRQCYGFIRQQAIKWARARENRPDFDADDLTQAGYSALCEAVRGFQEDRGSFIGFLSFHLKTEFSRVAGCRTEAQRKEPLNDAVSLDAPAFSDPDSETTLGETIPVNEQGFEDVEAAIFNEQLSLALGQAMSELPENQRRAIELRYLHGKTYSQIAEALNQSTAYTGQLLKGGLKRLSVGNFAPTLSELVYGDRNYYRGTGFTAWEQTRSSAVEREAEYRENQAAWLKHLVLQQGMKMEEASRYIYEHRSAGN